MGIGSASRSSSREPKFKPKVMTPKPEVKHAREAFQEALREKRTFWQDEIAQWSKEFDMPESLVGFLTSLGIERSENEKSS